MENFLKNTLLQDVKPAYIDRNIWKINIKSLPIAVIRVLNRLLYNLNVFHKQGKKFWVKNNIFSFGLKDVFSLAGMKNFLKNIWDNERNWFPLARKRVSSRKNKVDLYEMVYIHISDGFGQ